MSIFGRSARASSPLGDEHEHARALAATGLVEALSPADAASLASHLDACRECRQASMDYALQGERIHGLPDIDLPRDAWPAFAARLDAEEARVAEQRARRAGSRRVASQAHPLGARPSRGPGVLVPAGTVPGHRPSPIVASVGVGSALALVATIALVASGLPQMITGPQATPFAVDPSSVAWVTREADGRFLLQSAPVDSACPSGRTTCADFGSRPSTIVALDMEPASVFLSRGGTDAIVVDAGAAGVGSTGGSVYAIELPTPYPTGAATADATSLPGGPAAGAALATAVATGVVAATASPSATPRPSTATGRATMRPAPSPGLSTITLGPIASTVTADVPGASLPAAVPLPTAAATRAIAEDVILVGGRAAYSPDGRWFAFSARPADASAGPDVYVWRVGDERSRAVTSDHAAVLAGWVGDRLLVSAPDADLADPGAPAASAAPSAPPKAKASAKPAPSNGKAAASATPKPSKRPAATPSTDANASDGSAGKSHATDASAGTGSAAPEAGSASTPVSYLLDPVSGEVTMIDLPGLWLPSVDPTGSRVVAWLGTVRRDAATRSWRPAVGSLVVGSWSSVLGGAAPTASPSEEPTPMPVRTTAPRRTPTPATDAATASPRNAATQRPGHGATVAPTVAPDASDQPDATPAPEASDDLTTLKVGGLWGLLPATWQVRWDPTGTHLAVWVASGTDPEVGRLSLIAVDPTGKAAPTTLLSATPALPGFAIGKTRIAWATPQDGTSAGGRVRVLVWSGPSMGEAGTAPIRGLETLVEAD